MTGDASIYCSFCGRPEAEVRYVISGAGAYICDRCVTTCNEILDTASESTMGRIDDWLEESDERLLAQLPRVAVSATQIQDALLARVTELRRRGVTWARIGEALSITRQSAWERFGGDRAPRRRAPS
jgi:ClpX C4-type zinc finger